MVEKVRLGGSTLEVSRLCYGTEPFAIMKGPTGTKSQGDISPEQGGRVLKDALGMGVNFWDTSDDYGTHPHVRAGLALVDRGDVVVADKSNARTFEEAEKAVEFSLESLGTEYIDLLLLHNVPLRSSYRTDSSGKSYESGNLDRRMGALKAWCEAKNSGRVRAVGLSTHSTEILRKAVDVPELDVVCTTLNLTGTIIDDGSPQEHLDAIRAAHDAGKGVYVIKLLQAGRLRDRAEEAIKWALQHHKFIDAWNIGMYDTGDVARNLKFLDEVLP
jgi:aryl-alcohol dehydrogenase-like predicted oxidoreductase